MALVWGRWLSYTLCETHLNVEFFDHLSAVIDIPTRLFKLFADDLFSGLFFCFHDYDRSSSALVVES
jgi:hypothetical protein